MRTTMACALGALLLAGCVETETYDCLRSVARTGSPAEARADLARILPKASDETRGAVRVISIGVDAFTVAMGERRYEYLYAALEPRAIVLRGPAPAAVRDRIWIRLTPGGLDGSTVLTLERSDVVCLRDGDVDVESLLDALDTLKADAIARGTRPAPEPGPQPAPAPAGTNPASEP